MVTARQTADGAVKGSAARRTDRCCSLNKAFIARMCVHDPKRVLGHRCPCNLRGYHQLQHVVLISSGALRHIRTSIEYFSATTKVSLHLFMFISGALIHLHPNTVVLTCLKAPGQKSAFGPLYQLHSQLLPPMIAISKFPSTPLHTADY